MPESVDDLAKRFGGTITTSGAQTDQVDELARQFGGQRVGAPQGSATAPAFKSWSDRLGIPNVHQAAGLRAVVDLAEGAYSGLMKTDLHMDDMARRLVGAKRVDFEDPAIQNVMRPPDTAAGKIGQFAEQAAEYIVPGMGVAKVPRAVGLGNSVAAKMLAEGATAAAVGGAQTGGDPATMAMAGGLGAAAPGVVKAVQAGVGVVKRAAAGAKEGGLGGAAARAVLAVSDVEPVDTMFRAIKPASTRVNFQQTLRAAIPEIKASEAVLGRPIRNLDDLMEAILAAKKRVWGAREQILGPKRAMGTTVDLGPVADAISQSIPTRARTMEPEVTEAILGKVERLRNIGRISLQEAEEWLKNTNDELQAYYNKYPIQQRAALASDPAIAPVHSEAVAMRDAIEKALSDGGQGASARELAKRYGNLMEVEGQVHRRLNVAGRQQPQSLSEQIGAWSGIGDIARGAMAVGRGDVRGIADIVAGHAKREGAKFLKEQQTTDALIRRAMGAVKAYPSPPPPPIRGYLPPGPVRMPPVPDASGVSSIPARRAMRYNPETGKQELYFTGEPR